MQIAQENWLLLLSVMPRSIGKMSAHAFRQLFFLFNTAPIKITKAKLTLICRNWKNKKLLKKSAKKQQKSS